MLEFLKKLYKDVLIKKIEILGTEPQFAGTLTRLEQFIESELQPKGQGTGALFGQADKLQQKIAEAGNKEEEA